MSCYWICLQDTYIKRRDLISQYEEVSITFISEEDLKLLKQNNHFRIVVVEGRKLSSEVIDIATSHPPSCVLVENLMLNFSILQIIKLLAHYGIPVFWNIPDTLTYLKNISKISESSTPLHTLTSTIIVTEESFHSVNVARLSYQIARKFGCDNYVARSIYYGGLIHDVGKVAVPNTLLTAPRWLNQTERKIVALHTVLGHALIDYINEADETSLHIMKDVVKNHHERINGSGYPDGKKSNEISLAAKIVGVADVYDALRSSRPYRSACDHELAITYLKGKPNQFDPEIVKALESVIKEDKVFGQKQRKQQNQLLYPSSNESE